MSSVVPEGWGKIDLEEGISALVSGQSPNRKENCATGDAFGILKTTAIHWGRFDEKQNQEVLDDYEPNMKHLVLENDILITKAGPAHRVGVVAQARNLRSNVLLSGKMTALRVNDKFSSDFLTYALCQEEAQNHLKANTTGMASSQTNFTHDALLRVPILSPPLPEQKKIASILTSVDEVIENTQKQIDKLQDLKKATMNELLTKGIGNTEFKDSELGRIPKSWEVGKFDEFITLQRGHDLPTQSRKKGDIPIFGSNGIVGFHNNYIIKETGVITGRSGSIGEVYFLKGLYWALNTTLYVKDFHGNDAEFISHYLKFFDLERFATGTGVPTLNRNDVHNQIIKFPPYEEQLKICEAIAVIESHLELKLMKLSQTQSLKKSLMQDLLTGKVRVTVN